MQRFHEVLRFGVVGLFNAGTYFGLYAAGVVLGVPYLIAATVAFVLSASSGYWLHEHWTFRGGDPRVRGWLSWLAAQGTGTALNMVLLAITVDVAGWEPLIAQLVLMPISPVATYAIGKRWVFS